jgi:hypothetical protein
MLRFVERQYIFSRSWAVLWEKWVKNAQYSTEFCASCAFMVLLQQWFPWNQIPTTPIVYCVLWDILRDTSLNTDSFMLHIHLIHIIWRLFNAVFSVYLCFDWLKSFTRNQEWNFPLVASCRHWKSLRFWILDFWTRDAQFAYFNIIFTHLSTILIEH